MAKTELPLTEKQIQLQVSDYIKAQYPEVIFTFDAGGFRLPIGYIMMIKRMRSCNGIPDLLIFEPRGEYKGLFIELKKDNVKLQNKDGKYSTEHFKEQSDIIARLCGRGYYACFACGLDDAKRVIDNYLAGRNP